MSAPLSEPLFHGTGHILKVGDLVEPRSARQVRARLGDITLHKTINYAYATPDIEEAKKYAKKGSADQGTLFSPVYEVEPLKEDKTINHMKTVSWLNENGEHPLNHHIYDPTETEHVTSQKGFQVKKQVGWV